MQETNPSLIPEQHPSPQLDIDLAHMEALADPTLPPEVRERNTPKDTDAKIQKEELLQHEYARTITLYLQLQEAIESGRMPDFRRVSTSMPPAINTLIDEVATELMKLSLYATADKFFVKKELETMIRRHAFEEEIAEEEEKINTSKMQLERWRAEASDPEAENKRRAEEILATLKKNEDILMIPMPVVGEKSRENKESFWGGIRKRLLQ